MPAAHESVAKQIFLEIFYNLKNFMKFLKMPDIQKTFTNTPSTIIKYKKIR